jgi:hypothetical protein
MPTTTPRSAGLRKFVPEPDRYSERYGNFTLTARDLEILDLVYRYRYLEARHIRALLDGSGQQITRRLQGLFHNKYLGRYSRRERMRLQLATGPPLIAYGLELKGARALERHFQHAANTTGSMALPVLWRKDYTRRTEWFLEHHLMVSSFRCALEIELRRTPDANLVKWDQSKSIWFRVEIPGAQPRFRRVAPDAYFALRVGDTTRHYFLEADRSTEEHRRLLDRFVGYWWYLQDPRFAGPHGGRPNVKVLFVTTGRARMHAMIETLRRMPKPNRAEHGGKGLYRFCCEVSYDLDKGGSVLGAIWSSVKESELSLEG